MKVSIITVTYNSDTTLRDTIESVLSQEGVHLEYIIVDGQSSDRTLRIVGEYADRIACVVSEPDGGIYDAMNKGFRLATGDIVGILNSDDVYEDNHVLAEVVSCFERTPSVEGLFGDLYFVKASDLNAVVRQWKGSPYYPGAFRKGWHPAHPTFFVRRSVYERYGAFDVHFDVSADFELMLRLIEKEKITTCYLDRTLIRMRMGGESTGSVKKIIIGNKNVMRAFKKNGISVSPFYLLYRLLPKVWNMLKLKLIKL